MQQISVQVNATSTVYAFEAAGLHLNLTFFTPAFPQDLALLSRPVTYLTWTISSTNSAAHQVALFLDIDPRIAVNTPDQAVTWGRSHANGLNVLNVGSQEQRPLNRSGDNLRIDWGYFHLAVPENEALLNRSRVGALPNPSPKPAISPKPTTWTCPAHHQPARPISPSSSPPTSPQAKPSAATSSSPTPRASPSNIFNAASNPTGNATASPPQTCSPRPKQNILPFKNAAQNTIRN